MSVDQVEVLKAEIRASIRTAQMILGSILAAIVAVMTTFGVIFYQQGVAQRDDLIALSQQFKDMPKPNPELTNQIMVNTDRILTLQRTDETIQSRQNIQADVMREIQERLDKVEKAAH